MVARMGRVSAGFVHLVTGVAEALFDIMSQISQHVAKVERGPIIPRNAWILHRRANGRPCE